MPPRRRTVVVPSELRPKAAIETITPAQAEKYLERNVVNRGVRSSLVQRFIQVIYDGEWHLNGETIKFDSNGDLLDGQHRLMAIAEAGMAVPVVVVRNLPPETRSSIDIGARRTLADWLKMNGETDTVNLSVAINWYWRFTKVPDPRIKQIEYPTYHQALDFLALNPGLRDVTKEWRPRITEVTSRSAMLCALYYWFRETDPSSFDEFAELVWSGAGLARGDAILVLRRVLLNDRREQGTRTQSVNIAANTVKAFNYWRAGRQISSLSWRGKAEAFPRPLTAAQIQGGVNPDE
jgi:hypothetical protein